jgi:hypothetical protein
MITDPLLTAVCTVVLALVAWYFLVWVGYKVREVVYRAGREAMRGGKGTRPDRGKGERR